MKPYYCRSLGRLKCSLSKAELNFLFLWLVPAVVLNGGVDLKSGKFKSFTQNLKQFGVWKNNGIKLHKWILTMAGALKLLSWTSMALSWVKLSCRTEQQDWAACCRAGVSLSSRLCWSLERRLLWCSRLIHAYGIKPNFEDEPTDLVNSSPPTRRTCGKIHPTWRQLWERPHLNM